MTTAVAAPVGLTPQTSRPWRAVRALALFEARRLLQRPLVVITLIAYVGILARTRIVAPARFPVLQDVDRETQLGPLLVGLAMLIAANLAVLRSRRHGTETHLAVLLLRPGQQACAHALSVLPIAGLTAIVVAGQFAATAAEPGAVGNASFFELLTGPLLVVLFGVFGVLLGQFEKSVFTGPLAVVAIITVTFVFTTSTDSSPYLRWLSPLAIDEGARPLPSDLIGRPTGWHALYLAAFALLAGALAARTKAVACGALAVTVLAVVMQSTGPSDSLAAARRTATYRPASVQDCVRHSMTTYCAFPEFTSWTGRWRSVTESVRSLAGTPAATRNLTVRQRVYALDGPSGIKDLPPGPSGEATVGTAWGGERELEFAAGVARSLLTGDERHGNVYCDASGVLIVWLAIRAVPDGEADFATTQANISGGGATILAPVSSVTIRDREYAVVRRLLDQPRADVDRRVKASWAELTAPGTSTERAARLLGVTAPAETAADREWGCA